MYSSISAIDEYYTKLNFFVKGIKPANFRLKNLWPNTFRINFLDEEKDVNMTGYFIIPNRPNGFDNYVYLWPSNNWYADASNNGISQPVFETYQQDQSNWQGIPLYYSPVDENKSIENYNTIQYNKYWPGNSNLRKKKPQEGTLVPYPYKTNLTKCMIFEFGMVNKTDEITSQLPKNKDKIITDYIKYINSIKKKKNYFSKQY